LKKGKKKMLITCPKCSAKYQIPSEIKLSNGKKMQCSACGHIFEFYLKQEAEPVSETFLQPPADAVLSFDSSVQTIKVKTTSVVPEEPVLPEAFRPLETKAQTPPKTSSYRWFFLYILLFACLLMMGWLWHDLMMTKNQFPPFWATSVPVRVHKRPAAKPVLTDTPVIPVFADEEVEPQTENPLPSSQLSVQSVRFRKTPTGEAVLIEGVLKNTTTETIPVPEKIYALAYDTQGALAFEKEIYLPSGVLYPDMEQPFFGTYAPAGEEIQWIDVVLKK